MGELPNSLLARLTTPPGDAGTRESLGLGAVNTVAERRISDDTKLDRLVR